MARCQDGTELRERLDRSFDLLGSAYRRRVVYTLESDGPATVEELAEAVVTAGIADERERAVASLIHVHLPKLDDFDVVHYGTRTDPVRLADGVERLEPFLETARRRETGGDPILASDTDSGRDSVSGTTPD